MACAAAKSYAISRTVGTSETLRVAGVIRFAARILTPPMRGGRAQRICDAFWVWGSIALRIRPFASPLVRLRAEYGKVCVT